MKAFHSISLVVEQCFSTINGLLSLSSLIFHLLPVYLQPLFLSIRVGYDGPLVNSNIH